MRILNPAHAILGGAILSAIVTLVGVTLNIRSSERLANERDKRDAAVAEANQLKDKVTDLERKLDDALTKIPTTVPGGTEETSAPPQSIVVVVTVPGPPASVAQPTLAPEGASTKAPSTIKAAVSTEVATTAIPPSAPTSSTSTSTTSTVVGTSTTAAVTSTTKP